jgi:EmrB/QacA subfamily drug resistance transporter
MTAVAAEPIAPSTRATGRELWLILIGIMLALALAALDQNIVTTALPRIASEFGGLSHLSWVVTAFLVTSTITTPLYGKLSDTYGRKPTFFASITIFLIGSMLCGWSGSMTSLIVNRAIQGLGAGGLITLAQIVIGDVVSPRERGRYQGLFAAVFTVSSVTGPLLGGIITEHLSWRWVFYVNVPVGAAAMLMIGIGLTHRPGRIAHRLDYAGAALLSVATCCGLLSLSWGGNTYPWSSPEILGLSAAAITALVMFVLNERRAAEPLLPPRLFHGRVLVLSVTAIGLTAMSLFSAVVFLPLYFQLVQGATPTEAGLMVAPMMLGVIIASIGGGRLVSWSGRYKQLVVGGLLLAVSSFVALGFIAWSGQGAVLGSGILVILGLGVGSSFPNLTTAIQSAAPPGDLGVATAASSFFRSLGGAIGVALSGAVLNAALRMLLPEGASIENATSHLPSQSDVALVLIYRHALAGTFLLGAVVAGIACLTVALAPEVPLSGRSRGSGAA